jgi:phosphatidylglycerol lysyltransferase
MLEHELMRYGYVVLFFGAMVEGEGFLLTAAFLAHRGYLDIWLVIAVAATANTVADQIYYQIARASGREAFEKKAASDARFARVGDWIGRRGEVLLFMSRFMYGFRIAIPAACGAAGMAQRTFLLVNLAGGLVWASVTGLAGYALGNTVELVWRGVRHYEWYAAGVLLVVAAVVVARRTRDLEGWAAIWRGPAQAGAEFALALFGLTHRAGRLVLTSPHVRLAAFVAVLGCLNLASALYGWRFGRFESVDAWFPFEVTRGSRALMLLAGLALIVVGRGLARRKQAAWSIATGMTLVSVILHLLHHASIGRASLSALLLVELFRQRHRFTARSDPFRLRDALLAAPVLALALSVYGWAGMRRFEHIQRLPNAFILTWQTAFFQDVDLPVAPADPQLAAFLWSIRLFTVVSAGFLLAAASAPVAARHTGSADLDLVRRIAWKDGADSLTYFAKQPDKRHFLVGQHTFLGYRVQHRVAVVAGDPVGPPDRALEAINAFGDFCRRNDWIPVFYEASERLLPAYRAAGLRFFKVGEEAIIPLERFTLQGSKIANVRHSVTKVEREAPDLHAVEYRRDPPDPEVDEQLEDISAEWLASKPGGELGFNLGVFSVEDLADKRVVLAVRQTGRVEAFLTWLPYRAGHALVLDAMRRRSDAPTAVTEFLIARSALIFKGEGLEAISLATAPLANLSETGAASPYDKGVKLIFEHFSSFYAYKSLLFYKKKFNPVWEGRYLVFSRPDLLPRIAYALVEVHTPGGILSWFRR